MTRILVVDNNPKARGLLAEAVHVSDAEFATAGSAEEAIQQIAQESFDVVITDLQMETAKAGLDVLKAAKARDIYTQVIVITAYGTPQISVEAMRLGAFDYLEKNAPGTDVFGMIGSKVDLALGYRDAKLRKGNMR